MCGKKSRDKLHVSKVWSDTLLFKGTLYIYDLYEESAVLVKNARTFLKTNGVALPPISCTFRFCEMLRFQIDLCAFISLVYFIDCHNVVQFFMTLHCYIFKDDRFIWKVFHCYLHVYSIEWHYPYCISVHSFCILNFL